MKYTSGLLASLFNKTYTVSTESDGLAISRKNEIHKKPYLEIDSLKTKKGPIWSSVILTSKDQSFLLKGFSRETATAFVEDVTKIIQKELASKIIELKNQLQAVGLESNALTSLAKYISHTDLQNLAKATRGLEVYLSHAFFEVQCLPDHLQRTLISFLKLRNSEGAYVKELNEQFINKTIETQSGLFNSLEKYPLSDEQMRAAVIDEDRNLLIAAAGSGKTSSIVAKAIYLIASGLASPGQILVLAYNKDAQLELEKRFKDLIGIVPGFKILPKVKTFHGFGYELISQSSNQKLQICDFATDKKRQSQHFSSLIKDLYKSNEDFKNGWREFLLISRYQTPDLFSIETEKQYDEFLQELGAKRKKLPEGYRFLIPTIDGKEVRSFEEARIGNWLALNGVEYEYERQYVNPNSPDQAVKYLPDFYYPAVDLYHEHFAIDSNGDTPPFIPKEKYIKRIEWKRKTHQANGTKLIETHSAHIWDGTIFEVLKKQLEEHGVPIKPLSEEETNKLIDKKFDPDTDPDLFISFLNHFKANNFTIEALKQKLGTQNDRGRYALFLRLFEAIYVEYERRLKASNQVDFQDLINSTRELLESKKTFHPFKYILVDEFQDTSQDRKHLLQALLSQNDAIKLFAVGDDWQSIYRFSGADIEIMTNFSDHFGPSSINYLTKTYRSYQGITNIAAEFVQKNPYQLKKSVTAIEDSEEKQVTILGYEDTDDLEVKLLDLLTTIDSSTEGKQYSIFLLARYNHLKPRNIGRYKNLKINFHSIHSSKGLQADIVVLLNLEAGPYGFPSTISDDPLMSLVIPKPENYPHAEERRLLYVALTRAKRRVVIFSNQNYISPFATELSYFDRVDTEKMLPIRMNPCPECQTGSMQKRSGKYGIFHGCSNFPNCSYTEQIGCPECKGGKLKVRKSQYGEFMSCSNFPRCKYKENI